MKNRAFVAIGLIVIVFILLWLILSMFRTDPDRTPSLIATPTPTPVASPTSTELTETYSNDELNISFNYPAGWILHEDTVEPIRQVSVTSPAGFTLAVAYQSTTVTEPCTGDPETAVGTDQVNVLGRTLTIHQTGNMQRNTVSSAYALNTNQACDNAPYIKVPAMLGQPERQVSIEMYYDDKEQIARDEFVNADYQTAKRILETAQISL